MRINENISAVITNKHLLNTENSLSDVMERLSSGLKLNHAGDDPSGMAISKKMQAQIDGLDQASTNALNGSSVLETADGALNEVTNMLQRMRELAVQAANGTNSLSDKQAAQDEIDSLREEIDRVSSATEFNTKNLLDGSLDNRNYAEHVTLAQTSAEVETGTYQFKVEQAATRAEEAITIPDISTDASGTGFISSEGSVSINGSSASLSPDMTNSEVYEALRNAAEIGEASIDQEDGTLKSTAYGKDALLTLTFSNADIAADFGVDLSNATENPDGSYTITESGTDAVVDLNPSGIKGTNAFSDHASATAKLEGNKLTISDEGGFKMTMKLESGFEEGSIITKPDGTTETSDGVISMDVTDIGMMQFQIGANENQLMKIKIPAMDTKSMYIDDVDVTTINGAGHAISKLDDAIAYVSAARSSLGAYTNRLDYSKSSLDTTSENMTQAISRIQDADMAEEMTEYTKDNVLQQAATSVLAQANQLPQTALQLLQ